MATKSGKGRRYRVLADYEVNDPHPLVLDKGQAVEVIRQDESWPGWVWVSAGQQAGWVPAAFLADAAQPATTAVKAYSGKDLSARRGAVLTAVESAPGWIVAEDEAGRRGWFPLFNLRPDDRT